MTVLEEYKGTTQPLRKSPNVVAHGDYLGGLKNIVVSPYP